MTTKTAEKNVAATERAAHRAAIQAEQKRLDTISEGKRNAARAKTLATAQAQRIAQTLSTGAAVEFTVQDGAATHVVTVKMIHEDAVVRTTARAAVIALARFLTFLSYERISAAQIGAPGPDIGARLTALLDADECRAAKKFGVLTVART
jgi:hypothetical protein